MLQVSYGTYFSESHGPEWCFVLGMISFLVDVYPILALYYRTHSGIRYAPDLGSGKLLTAYGNKSEIKGLTKDFTLTYLGRFHTVYDAQTQ